tara:strand:+ start:2154 stop:2699 length:546 start_codon:yes stop_codon:yes gene_type:complete
MKEIELTKTSIFVDHLNKSSLLKNREIKRNILTQIKSQPKILKNLAEHDDIKVFLNQHMCWVMDHQTDFFYKHVKKNLSPIGDVFAIFKDQHQSTKLKNYENPYNLYDSPDYTYIYVVQSGSSENYIVFEYDNHIRKKLSWQVPLETGKFIMWNSSLNYYLTPNKTLKSTIAMLVHCQIKK